MNALIWLYPIRMASKKRKNFNLLKIINFVYFYTYTTDAGERELLSKEEIHKIKRTIPKIREGLKIKVGNNILKIVHVNDDENEQWLPSLSKSVNPEPMKKWVGTKIFEAINLLYLDSQVAFIGEKSTGKNFLCEIITETFNLDYFQIAGSEDVRETSIMGQTEIREGKTKFVEGILPQWARNGGLLVIDESNMIEPAILMRINETTDFRRQVTISKKTVIKRGGDSYLILTLNPTKEAYAGTHNLNLAFLDRFSIISFESPSIVTEIEILKRKNLTISEKIHEAVKKSEDSMTIKNSPTLSQSDRLKNLQSCNQQLASKVL